MDIPAFYLFAGIVILIIAVVLLAMAIKIANQWERAVVLFLGRFVGIRGPGIFLIVPFLSRVAYWIDLRVITTSFNAEQTLTKDTVPVNVDAVLFWQVIDVQKAALEVKDYRDAISLASQTALRDVIGKTLLADMLAGREAIDAELQKMIGNRVSGWGIRILSVEIRDVVIPGSLQDAMSMQAQAERERQARVILGDSERQIAEKFEQAAKSYENNPTALHLRAMNMLYEGLKTGNATIVLVPATALESMNLGAITGTTALAETLAKEPKQKKDQPLEQP
ncbi:band 7 protein [Methanoregula boonei 6A8]|uniref:Band 7 protein n=1 Tax=Methanoregula boonei (strain DSM 21154 / JCM 14090 / 6A8) TaxID=456442 RepID=A7I7I0_METB6|nr:slipin family protein [Methanoregula boonei]ABS55691.1 band 7 protein [Methanoregula boonei 6A8]